MVKDIPSLSANALEYAAGLIINRMVSAPKAKGVDDVSFLFLDGQDKSDLADRLRTLGEELKRPGMIRDAVNLDLAGCVILLGAKKMTSGLNCGFCGIPTCAESIQKDLNCAYPSVDLGIAIGSGLSLAQQLGLDCRVMYTIGYAAMKMNLFKDSTIRVSLGIPFSISTKNIFFDRK